MAQITAALVKELRESTGAGMMDCKKALSETDGDVTAAQDWLRKKGLAAAAKKAGRVASEGLVGVAAEGTKAAVVEVNSETDFVARNDQFQGFVTELAKVALSNEGDIEVLKKAAFPGTDKNVEDQLTNLVATIGENMSLRRVKTLSVEKGVIAKYVHNAQTAELGKIGVLVALESEGDADKLAAFGKQIAMHIAAAKPEALSIDEVDSEALERERTVLIDQAKASGRPDNIIEKMVEGRIRKYYEQVVLLEQTYVIDGENKVSVAVENFAKELGSDVKLVAYARYALGEGIEKKEEDFAAEVAKTAGQ